jgi:uncharacterized protein (DUF427 family)
MYRYKPKRPELKQGEEWVWDYPRPPGLERFSGRIEIVAGGEKIVDTTVSWRILETSHPPVYYISPRNVRMTFLATAGHASFCEWKGLARYYNIQIGARTIENAAWTYPDPVPAYSEIRDHIAFYAHLMDACYIDGTAVIPQPGNFYGGWITPGIIGPFKGGPGSLGW